MTMSGGAREGPDTLSCRAAPANHHVHCERLLFAFATAPDHEDLRPSREGSSATTVAPA